MADQLEDFIRRNRAAFDDKEPADKAWGVIEQSLPGKRLGGWNQVAIWRAAAIFFMVASGYLLFNQLRPTQQPVGKLALKEFQEVEAFYVQQIAMKESLIDDFSQTDGLNGFTMDFKQLEAMYSVLKEEMKVRPSQKVKDALILNLLVRIDLLNQQLHKIEKEEEQNTSDKPTTTDELAES